MSRDSARYDAFISYSHAEDREIARRLQTALQRFGKRWYELRSLLVYRDETNLAVTPQLWPAIQDALASSKFFILLASPKAASSTWVQRELAFWLEQGRTEQLLIVVTAGSIARDPAGGDFDWDRTTSLPRSIAGALPEEPLYLDLTWARAPASDLSLRNAGFRGAVVSLAARITGREMHEIDSEEVRRHRSVVRLASIVGTALAAFVSIATIAGVLLHNEKKVTESDTLAASASSQVAWNPERALILAVRAEEVVRTPRSDEALRVVIAHSPVTSLRAGDLSNGSIAVSRGTLLVATRGRIERWLLGTGNRLPPIWGDMSPHGLALVRTSESGAIELRGTEDDHLRASFPGERYETFSSDGRLVVTSANGALHVRSALDGSPLADVKQAGRSVRDIALSRDSTHVVMAFQEHPPVIVDRTTGSAVTLPQIPGGFTYSVSFDPSGAYVLFGTEKGVSVWSSGGAFVRNLATEDEAVEHFAFSPDGQRLATAGGNGVARVWRWRDGSALADLPADRYGVGSAEFSPDGRVIVTWTYGYGAQVWDAATYRQLAGFGGGSDPVADVAFDSQRPVVIVAHLSGSLRGWNIDEYAPVRRYGGHRSYLENAVFSPDQTRIATASVDDTARIYDANSGICLHTLPHDSMVRHVAFSPDGTKVATGTTDGSATVWAVATGQRLLRLTGHVRDVEWIEFSGDGRLIATAGMDGTARIWNAENGDKVSGIGPIQNAVKSVRFNTDGTQIVAGCGDNVTRLWTVGGTLLREFHGHTDIVNSATLSPDGKRILTASDDGTARVWDAQSGEVILILTQPDPVHTAEFSGDGALIVTSAGFNPVVTATIPPDGNIVRIWDAATGQLVDELRAHATLVSAATFGHDGSILTTSWDNVASLFRPAATAGIAQLLEEGHRRIARFSTAPPPPHPLPASPPRAARP